MLPPMRMIPSFAAGRMPGALILLAGLASLAPAPAVAQYIGGNAPPPPAAPVGPESPSAALARNVRILAGSPRDFGALMGAGRAAIELGDYDAAAGFFGRADEVRPSAPEPKIGMGAIAVQTGDTSSAMAWFSRAQALGAGATQMGADRGLAHDLLGEQGAAQTDYRAALGGVEADEARRRLALSLAISGRSTEALKTLEPLLLRRDAAAQRTRAFVLALGGNRAAADSAIEAAMPGSSRQIDRFFALLPSLSPTQKAAAVHLGQFPEPSLIDRASATPTTVIQVASAPPPPAPPRRVAEASRRTAARTAERALNNRTDADYTQPVGASSLFAWSFERAKAKAAAEQGAAPVVEAPAIEQPPPPAIEAAPQPAPAQVSLQTAPSPEPVRLAELDRAIAAPPPPAPRPKIDRAAIAAKKLADAKKAADARKLADAKKAADLAAKKDREEAARLGTKGTYWVQLAGGSNQGRMATEFKRIKAKKPTLFAGRSPYVSGGKDYFRLLLGPFDDASDAHSMVAKLDKAGIDSFTWTRSPAQIRIEKLST